MATITNPGPLDSSVLYDQENHVSAAVWEGQERGVLRCHEHTSMLEHWKLNPQQIELVEKAGLGYLRKIPSFSLDNSLISALVERWRKETNTFHFPTGEMTITLEDAGLILGLSIDGEPVIGSASNSPPPVIVCENLLGKAPDDLSGGMVKLTWLKECFSKCPEDAPIEIVENYTRAYILYLVGSTIFSTTTGNKVSIVYLPFFENFDEAGKFAWGAAALSFLYRTLGNASLRSQGTISGSLTLLQCWCYFHLNVGRPKINDGPNSSFPFALRWKGRQSGSRSNTNIIAYRKSLDSLAPSDIQWLPYEDLNMSVVPEHIKVNLDLKASKTMLICIDKAERQMPDRCLRQFGLPQPIPENVQLWEKKIRARDQVKDLRSESKFEVKGIIQAGLKEWFDRKLRIVGDVADMDESDYINWYEAITRKFVGRPESIEAEFQRAISAMKEIADIADLVSMERMEAEDKKLLSDIKSSLQSCLTETMGEPQKGRRKNTVKRKRSGDSNGRNDSD